MSATSDQVLLVLQSIDATLKELLALSKTKRAATPAPAQTVSDAQDLDSKYGDEQIKFDPRNWSGKSYRQHRMSECPPEFLDQMADAYAYFAQKNDESQAKTDAGMLKSTYDRRSERRARGWAARLRSGWTAPASSEPQSDFVPESDIKW